MGQSDAVICSIKIVSFQICLRLFHVDQNQTTQFVWGKENSSGGGGDPWMLTCLSRMNEASVQFSGMHHLTTPRRRKKLEISLWFYSSRSLVKKWHVCERGEECIQFQNDPGLSQKSDIEGGTEPLFASCFLYWKVRLIMTITTSILALLNEFLTTETLGKYFDTKLLGL